MVLCFISHMNAPIYIDADTSPKEVAEIIAGQRQGRISSEDRYIENRKRLLPPEQAREMDREYRKMKLLRHQHRRLSRILEILGHRGGNVVRRFHWSQRLNEMENWGKELRGRLFPGGKS